MRRLLSATMVAGVLAAAAGADPAEAPPVRYDPMHAANGCFVESVACFDAFHEAAGADAWGRVLQWGAEDGDVMVAGHAVAVFEAGGRLWCYDINYGWAPLSLDPASRNSAELVAAPALKHYPKIVSFYPVLWDDSGQEPGTSPPEIDESDAVARDAAKVAARLALHRPVNVVTFTITANGEPRPSYAVVFLFGGRTCFYSPLKGTSVFRVRTTVYNVRLILAMVQNQFPGATDIHSLAAQAPSGTN